MDELEQLRKQVRVLLEEKEDRHVKRHLSVPEVAKLYGYTPEEIRRMAIDEKKLRFIPVGCASGAGYKKTNKQNAYRRIKFDRFKLEEDFEDLMIVSPHRKTALDEKNRPKITYVNPNKGKYLRTQNRQVSA